MAMAAVAPILYGHAAPRLAPPVPARSIGPELHALAAEIGTSFFPWQDTAARYLYALGPDDTWLYPEVAIIVARQNGKTEILVSHIVKRLLAGRRIMHTAQNRNLPREVFRRVAGVMTTKYSAHLSSEPRFANGQEEIVLRNGGKYSIVAPTGRGPRGETNDDLIVDEVRELDTHDFVGAARPTLSASPNSQILYLSNMGDESSVVLKSLIDRATSDPALAYLEWSADPAAPASDVAGWLGANPAAGHMPQVLGNLERTYRSHLLGKTMAIFETEHLCRSVISLKPQLVDADRFAACEQPDLEETPRRGALGIAVHPDAGRASIAVAWPRADGTIGLRMLFDVSPHDPDLLGKSARRLVRTLGATTVGYGPLTDQALARYFIRTEAVGGQKWANATARFVDLVTAGKVRWEDAAVVGADLERTTRRQNGDVGSFEAVASSDEHPITAVQAAIRAIWLASAPRPEPAKPRPSAVGF